MIPTERPEQKARRELSKLTQLTHFGTCHAVLHFEHRSSVPTLSQQCSNSVLTPLWQEVLERSNTFLVCSNTRSIPKLAF